MIIIAIIVVVFAFLGISFVSSVLEGGTNEEEQHNLSLQRNAILTRALGLPILPPEEFEAIALANKKKQNRESIRRYSLIIFFTALSVGLAVKCLPLVMQAVSLIQ